MFFRVTFALFVYIALVFGASEFAHLTTVICSILFTNLTKCRIKDNECLRKLYQVMIREVGKNGMPEIGIPPVDPFVLKNVSVSVFNLIDLAMVDGVATGVKDCVFKEFEIDIANSTGTQEVVCDITVKGHYTLSSNIPALNTLLGNNGIHGDGNGKVKLEKILMDWKFIFYPEKHSDGEIYIKCLYKEIKYNYDVKGKASFAADSIYIGNADISKFAINFLNENWKFVFQTFGQPFIDKAMEFYFSFAQKFFEGVPTRYYILDDLTPYIRN